MALPAFALFGPPGCGKGTQAVMIKDRLGFLHVSTGDIFRNAIARKDPQAMEAQEIMQRGELVPDELIRDMLSNELSILLKEQKDAKGLILDGFPRTVNQAGLLDALLEQHQLRFMGVLSLEVEEEELIQRLINRAKEQGRADDTEDVIRERMRVYREKTQPLEEYYKDKKMYFAANGVGSLEEVYTRIVPIIQSWM
ncbi:MAG: adenylate kinase [bacterium]|jgi:adenylate kinase|nr:adenylate kinase [bacterium]